MSNEMTLQVKSVTVITSKETTDLITITFQGDSPFPSWLPDAPPTLEMKVASGIGVRYCLESLHIHPSLINIIHSDFDNVNTNKKHNDPVKIYENK